MSDVKSKVISIIVDKLGVDEGEVASESSFTNDLGADSLDTVELIMEFEKEFNIAIPDEQAENIQTVGEAIKYSSLDFSSTARDWVTSYSPFVIKYSFCVLILNL